MPCARPAPWRPRQPLLRGSWQTLPLLNKVQAPPPLEAGHCRSSYAPPPAPLPLGAGSPYGAHVAAERWSWQLKPHSRESIKPTNVANLWVNQRSQITEDTIEPSLAAQDINPITYLPALNFAARAGFIPGSVQLTRPGHVLSLALAHSTTRPNRQLVCKIIHCLIWTCLTYTSSCIICHNHNLLLHHLPLLHDMWHKWGISNWSK